MNDMILILNYSDEFAVEAARRLRGEQVFCKIISGMTTAAQIAQAAPRGIVLCGEPQSAAGVFDAEILKLGIPVLALGHAAHMLITAMGGHGHFAQESVCSVRGVSAVFRRGGRRTLYSGSHDADAPCRCAGDGRRGRLHHRLCGRQTLAFWHSI